MALMNDDLRKIQHSFGCRGKRQYPQAEHRPGPGDQGDLPRGDLRGMATMWMAVFADMGVSLLVVFNGLRLLRK